MITAKKVKQFARSRGADLVGIASMDRFEGAPKEMDPRYIFPEAKAFIVLGFRIPRGCFRGIEEGTFFGAYPSMGYAGINLVYAPIVLREVTLFLEDEGYESVPIQNALLWTSRDKDTGKLISGSIPVSPDKPAPDVFIHIRLAAVAAGLGEIGYSNMFLSPEYGPRQRLAGIITDAPLKPDPLFEGKICDRCMSCVKECPGKSISKDKTVKIKLAGKEMEWGELNVASCNVAYTGGVAEKSPFIPPDFDFEKALKDPWNVMAEIPYNKISIHQFRHFGAIGGAEGCIRACMAHLEKTGRIKAKFVNPFRKKKLWSLPSTRDKKDFEKHPIINPYS